MEAIINEPYFYLLLAGVFFALGVAYRVLIARRKMPYIPELETEIERQRVLMYERYKAMQEKRRAEAENETQSENGEQKE